MFQYLPAAVEIQTLGACFTNKIGLILKWNNAVNVVMTQTCTLVKAQAVGIFFEKLVFVVSKCFRYKNENALCFLGLFGSTTVSEAPKPPGGL